MFETGLMDKTYVVGSLCLPASTTSIASPLHSVSEMNHMQNGHGDDYSPLLLCYCDDWLSLWKGKLHGIIQKRQFIFTLPT